MGRKIRVLVVTRNLPPLVGGMERLMAETVTVLSEEYDVAVVGPAGCELCVPGNVKVRPVPPAPLWKFLALSLARTCWTGLAFKPDIILSGSGMTAPIALLARVFRRIPVVTWLHGLDVIALSRVYQGIFVPMFRRCDLVLVNSNHTANLARDRGVQGRNIRVLHPGVRVSQAAKPSSVRFREKYQLGGRRLLLCVGRLTRRKGLAEFVGSCMPAIVEAIPDVTLVIVGDDATAAAQVSRIGERTRISEAAMRAGVSGNILFVGTIGEEDLAAAYSAASLHIFPVADIPGDVEGFGIVALEAAAHGVPTIAFSVGGVPDAVSDGKSGWLVDSGDYESMTRRVIDWMQSRNVGAVSAEACRLHASRLSWDRFADELRSVFRFLGSPRT